MTAWPHIYQRATEIQLSTDHAGLPHVRVHIDYWLPWFCWITGWYMIPPIVSILEHWVWFNSISWGYRDSRVSSSSVVKIRSSSLIPSSPRHVTAPLLVIGSDVVIDTVIFSHCFGSERQVQSPRRITKGPLTGTYRHLHLVLSSILMASSQVPVYPINNISFVVDRSITNPFGTLTAMRFYVCFGWHVADLLQMYWVKKISDLHVVKLLN